MSAWRQVLAMAKLALAIAARERIADHESKHAEMVTGT